ncbi:MAG: hypothetical protein U5J98_08160 [Halobacteriales archaeon]|nr:hypothetical protein [Halobacteriales archaeon]
MDNRAVSAVLGYILALAVMALVVSGLFVTAGNYVENQQERAIRAELEVVGNRLAADIAAIDRLALATGSSGEAELVSNLPPRTARQSYLIEIDEVTTGVYHLNLSTSDPDVSVTVKMRVQTTMIEDTVNGGDVRISFDGNEIEVADA